MMIVPTPPKAATLVFLSWLQHHYLNRTVQNLKIMKTLLSLHLNHTVQNLKIMKTLLSLHLQYPIQHQVKLIFLKYLSNCPATLLYPCPLPFKMLQVPPYSPPSHSSNDFLCLPGLKPINAVTLLKSLGCLNENAKYPFT
jgi:hypothetical protein